MPINHTILRYEGNIFKKLGINYSGLTWCELGNQRYEKAPAKKAYEKSNVKHTSIDINGLDGAIPLDLDKPVPSSLENKFDIVTNYGTTEHVNNQYSVFKNIHVMCKVGGLMIHGVPAINNWPDHCRYYYSELLFRTLAVLCNYVVIDLTLLSGGKYKPPYNLIMCVLKKADNHPFTFTTTGMLDSGCLTHVITDEKKKEYNILTNYHF